MKTEEELAFKLQGNIIFMSWLLQNRKISDLIKRLGDDELKKEVAPGRNSGLYLLGHLIASNDLLQPLFGFGEKMYPEYEKIFLCTPDKCAQKFPQADQMKLQWFALNDHLRDKFAEMDEKKWNTESHLLNERLSAMLNIVNHQSYHLGQLIFLL